MTPHNVLPFGRRRSYQEAVREQQDCQQEAPPNPVHEGLNRIKDWLDSGIDPVEACAREADRSRALITAEAKALSEYATPRAAAAFMRKLADEIEPQT